MRLTLASGVSAIPAATGFRYVFEPILNPSFGNRQRLARFETRPRCIATVAVMLLLLSWWLDCLGHRIVVTDQRTIFRKGLLSKFTNEILHSHVRNIQINQSVFQRLMHVGSIGISSSGQAGIEIFIRGIPNPYDVKSIIDQYRFGESALSTDANAIAEQYQHPVA